MSVPPKRQDVTAQNQKLFVIFKQKFASTKFYMPAAKKLGDWLSNEKAYYPEARKEIVEILLVAQNTLRECSLIADVALTKRLHESFAQLVFHLVPFQQRFVEPDLQAQVTKFLGDVGFIPPENTFPPPNASLPQMPSANPGPAPPPMPSSIIDPSQQMRPSSSSLASALTPMVASKMTVAPTNPPVSTSGISNYNLVSNTQTVASGVSSSSVSAPIASTSQPIRKRKKMKDDLSNLIQTDIQLYKQKGRKPAEATETVAPSSEAQTSSAAGNPEIHDNNAQVAPLARSHIVEIFNPLSSVITLSSEGVPTASPQMVSAVDISVSAPVGSSIQTPSAIEDTPMRLESNPSELQSPSPQGNGDNVIMSIPDPFKDVEMIDSYEPDVSLTSSTTVYGFLTSPSNVESAPTSTSAPPEALSPATENEVNRVFRTLTDPGSSVEIIASLSNNTPNPTTADTSDLVDPNSDQTILPPCTSIETTDLVPEAASITSMEGIEPTPLPPQGDSTRIVASTAPENVVINPPADPSAAFKAIIQSMISANKLIASSADIPSPTLPTPPPTDDKIQADGAVLGELTPNIPNTVEDDNKTKIGIQAATIIARHRGLKSGTINVEFSINKVQLVSIAKWNNRMKHPGDIKKSLCITLLCISSADLETSESKDIRTLLPELECSWPKNGGLSMNALWNEQRMDFPMSPPFALPKNGFVDVSPFLVLGQNTFRITQTHDMSAYWLILCAHHPTPSQLHGVARHRHKERDWTGWLEKMSKPLQLPFRIPIEV